MTSLIFWLKFNWFLFQQKGPTDNYVSTDSGYGLALNRQNDDDPVINAYMHHQTAMC